jgi:hypothetical protein
VINSGDHSRPWPQMTLARSMLNADMTWRFSRLHRNRARIPLHALLLGITGVGVSRAVWALPGPASAAAESSRADTSERRSPSESSAELALTPGAPDTRADSGHDPGSNPRRYVFAFGGALLTGPAGRTGGFGTIQEGYVRAGVLPWLGLGVSYFNLSVSNTDNYPPVGAQAFAINASWHPLKYSSFDPFLQLGGLRLFNVRGNVYAPAALWVTEAQLGVNLVLPHLAIGVQARRAFGDFAWLMVGFQVEGRI